jgi:GH43 family beta-xylosidase
VNALHRQAIDRLGHGLRVAARDRNGIVQAIEHESLPLVVGVQWHPEFLPQVPQQRAIFRLLVQRAASRRAHRPITPRRTSPHAGPPDRRGFAAPGVDRLKLAWVAAKRLARKRAGGIISSSHAAHRDVHQSRLAPLFRRPVRAARRPDLLRVRHRPGERRRSRVPDPAQRRSRIVGRGRPRVASAATLAWPQFLGARVAEKKGKFYLFYSSSPKDNDEHHRIRVAVASSPTGPFDDTEQSLMPDAGFSIDAHPFFDPRTNKWYLFFATDYTLDEPHGTGLAVAPLADDLLSVTAPPRVVIRASCDWQVYERQRNYKGKIWKAWHCVEGPFVLFRDDKYYCLYSGGAWHSENYGLGFAVATDPLGPWTDEMATRGPTVLKGAPPRVIGPGHNSVVLGPDGRTLYCVYHAWDAAQTARRMCIDPLVWTPDGPKCDGPSTDQRTILLP